MLENAGVGADAARFALTLWLVDDDEDSIADEAHPLAAIRRSHFQSAASLEK